MSFIYQKIVDRSTLFEGFTIPQKLLPILHQQAGGPIECGEKRNITIIIQGVKYEAVIKNQKFDRGKYPTHKDVVQIRYPSNSPLPRTLRSIFSETFRYVEQQKNLPANRKRKLTIKTPEPIREYIVLRSTIFPDVYVADVITSVTKAITAVNDDSMLPLDSLPRGEYVLKDDLAKLSSQVDVLSSMLKNQQESIDKISQPLVISVNNASIDVARLMGVDRQKQTSTADADKCPDFSQVSEQQFQMACLQLDLEKYNYQGGEGWLMQDQKDWYYVGRIASETGFFGLNYQTSLVRLLRQSVRIDEHGHRQTIRVVPSNTSLSRMNSNFGQPAARLYDSSKPWHTIANQIDENALAKARHIAHRFVAILQLVLAGKPQE